jgi:small nuclear ribonucleoprotein (snRNP)-like protein
MALSNIKISFHPLKRIVGMVLSDGVLMVEFRGTLKTMDNLKNMMTECVEISTLMRNKYMFVKE